MSYMYRKLIKWCVKISKCACTSVIIYAYGVYTCKFIIPPAPVRVLPFKPLPNDVDPAHTVHIHAHRCSYLFVSAR